MKFFFNKSVEVERLVADHDNIETYVSICEMMAEILPIGANDILLTEGNPARECKLYADKNANLLEADRISWDDKKYIVRAVRKWGRNSIAYKEALLEEIKN